MDYKGLTAPLDYESIKAHADHLKSTVSPDKTIGISIEPGLSLACHLSSAHRITDAHYPFASSWISGAVQIFELPDASSMQRVDAIRVLKQIGSAALISISRCNPLEDNLDTDNVILITDHINLAANNPLTGINDTRIGPRYTNMIEPYDKTWSERIEKIAEQHNMPLTKGIFVNVDRPITPAERIMLRQLGGMVFGTGLAEDVLTAVHCGLPVAAIGFFSADNQHENREQTQYNESDFPQEPMTAVSVLLKDLFEYL